MGLGCFFSGFSFFLFKGLGFGVLCRTILGTLIKKNPDLENHPNRALRPFNRVLGYATR